MDKKKESKPKQKLNDKKDFTKKDFEKMLDVLVNPVKQTDSK